MFSLLYFVYMKKETIVSGIQPSGRLHVGVYLGAIKQFLELQNQGNKDYYFTIVDLHAITVPQDPKDLKANTLDLAASYLAAGLDPEKSTIFIQSHVLEHASLGWILNCITPIGELERMTQFKDKSKRQGSAGVGAGLLNYPTLMAADILLYKSTLVPVGEDQMQHLELTRVIARKFNKQFGEIFPEPRNFALKPLRIMSLTEPERKMSKSEPKGCVFMDDSPAEILAKLKKATTGSDAKAESRGAQHLMFLLSQFGTQEHIAQFQSAARAGELKNSELKTVLASDIANYFAEFREKKLELLAKPEMLAQILGDGAQKAKRVAHATLAEVKAKIGLL